MSTTIVGFDSAWTDKATAPGAVCGIREASDGSLDLVAPRLATFAQAFDFITAEMEHAERVIVALDQPTIVPNTTGSRPVDKVAGSLVSWTGGGVQPANRSKVGMFDDTAPIWSFLSQLGAEEDPEAARRADRGLYLIEVFPALALPSLIEAHCGRLLGARYNPERRKTFRLDHWASVTNAIAEFGLAHQISGMPGWANSHRGIVAPRKRDQDLLDAVLCAMVGYLWMHDRGGMLMLGDLATGYMITPGIGEARDRLLAAARIRGLPAN